MAKVRVWVSGPGYWRLSSINPDINKAIESVILDTLNSIDLCPPEFHYSGRPIVVRLSNSAYSKLRRKASELEVNVGVLAQECLRRGLMRTKMKFCKSIFPYAEVVYYVHLPREVYYRIREEADRRRMAIPYYLFVKHFSRPFRPPRLQKASLSGLYTVNVPVHREIVRQIEAVGIEPRRYLHWYLTKHYADDIEEDESTSRLFRINIRLPSDVGAWVSKHRDEIVSVIQDIDGQVDFPIVKVDDLGPKRVFKQIPIPDPDYRRIRKLAAESGITVSDLIRSIIMHEYERRKPWYKRLIGRLL